MNKPTDSERCLLILLLRFLGLSQDDVASIVRCHKMTVPDTEKWFAGLPYSEAAIFCSDTAIKTTVGRELVIIEETSNELLVKAAQVSGDDILRHHRSDYLKQRVNVMSVGDRDKHWADFAIVADVLLSNLRKIQGAGDNAEIVGDVIDGGSIWFDGESPPIHFSRTDREDPQKLEKVDSYLAQRLLEHLMGHSQMNDWNKLAKAGISDNLIDKLLSVAHGGIFEETTCKMCKPWYQ